MEITYHTGGDPDTSDTVDFESEYKTAADWLSGELMHQDAFEYYDEFEDKIYGYEFGDSTLSVAAEIMGIKYQAFESMYFDMLIKKCPEFARWIESKFLEKWTEWETENHLNS